MSMSFAQLPGARWLTPLYGTGSSSVTLTGHCTSMGFITSAGGTITITPGGANQSPVANTAITLPANGSLSWDYPVVCMLGPGTIVAFTAMDSVVVTQAKNVTGA